MSEKRIAFIRSQIAELEAKIDDLRSDAPANPSPEQAYWLEVRTSDLATEIVSLEEDILQLALPPAATINWEA